MDRTVHELPSSAQMNSKGTHVRVEERREQWRLGRILVRLTWGWVDADGVFYARKHSEHPSAVIEDMSSFLSASTNDVQFELREDVQDQAEADILDYLDTHSLWPTQE
jgi:hypothetical protein